MKVTKKLLPLAVSVALAAPALMATTTAQAGVSATVGAANMYLWRGINLTPDGPQVSGSIDYSHDSGFYAGAWMTNEDAGHETDLYVGFGTEIAGLGIDVSYWKYLYPEDDASGNALRRDATGYTAGGLGDTDVSDVVVGLSYGPVSFTAYVCVESGCDAEYYTLGAEFGKFGLMYGFWNIDGTGVNEYSHIQASYAFNDNISFTVSKARNDSGFTDAGVNPTGVEEDPLFVVSFSKTFDM